MSKNRKREYKTVPQYLKGVDGNTVDGVFSVSGILDSYRDIVEPGAFTKTFDERGGKTLHLWQHDFFSPPTAVIESLVEIGRQELPEIIRVKYPESTGGAMVSRTYFDSPRAKEVLAAITAGSPLQMSFGYDTIRYEMRIDEETDETIRHLLELRLWETSDVLWGANEATLASKELPPIAIETVLGALDNYLSSLKEGRRNATTDAARINQIAILAFELGATSIKLVEEEADDEDKAASGEQEASGDETAITPETEAAEEEATDVEEVEEEEPVDDEKQQSRAGELPPLTLLFAELELLELCI